MANDPTSDLDVESNVVFEYAQAMAAAAESGLRYPDRMRQARSEAERTYIRENYAGLLKRTINAHRIAFAAMISQPVPKKGINMPNWLKHVGMAVAGAAAIAVSVFVPPVAPFLGPIGTKLLIAGGGTALVAAASPEHIKSAINAVRGKN